MWHATEYQIDNSIYGSAIWVAPGENPQSIVDRRNIGEVLFDQKPFSKRPDVLASELIRKRRMDRNMVMHALCWEGFLAISSGTMTVLEVLGDKGVMHEVAHFFDLKYPKKRVVVAMVHEMERKIPGLLK